MTGAHLEGDDGSGLKGNGKATYVLGSAEEDDHTYSSRIRRRCVSTSQLSRMLLAYRKAARSVRSPLGLPAVL